jgi:hypothetical protein
MTPTELPPLLGDDIIIGAQGIARFLYGNTEPKAMSDVYRNPAKFSFFKHGGLLAARKSTLRHEVFEMENKARLAREAASAGAA